MMMIVIMIKLLGMLGLLQGTLMMMLIDPIACWQHIQFSVSVSVSASVSVSLSVFNLLSSPLDTFLASQS